MIYPNIKPVIKYDLGKITKLKDGIPDSVKYDIGMIIANWQGRRIRLTGGGRTYDGEVLDANAAGYAAKKIREGMGKGPLVLTGELTEFGANTVWQVTLRAGNIVLKLRPDQHEKWDNIMGKAEDFGLNWNRAWGVGELEYTDALKRLLEWAANELGVKIKK